MGRSRLGTLYKKSATAAKWSGAFTHPVTGQRVLATLYTDKQASRAALDRMIKDAERSAEGLEPAHADQRRRPITEHIEDYLAHCRHERQAAIHIQAKELHLHRFIDSTNAKRIDDFKLEAAAGLLRGLVDEGKGARAHNYHRATLVAFMNWAVHTERIASHRLGGLPKLDERCDQRRHRRALTEDELQRLLTVARWRPIAEFGRGIVKRSSKEERQGRKTWTRDLLTIDDLDAAVKRGRRALAKRPDVEERLERVGRERELIYRTLVLTGLRKGELASLTVPSLHLDHKPAYAVLGAKADKARLGAEIPFRADLAAEIRGWLADRLARAQADANRNGRPVPARLSADATLFNVPTGLIRILERDLRAAGIPKRDDRGYTVDVHALRHTFGTHLSRSGVLPRTAQAAMRHSDITLTMNLYTDPRLLDVASALNALPRLRIPIDLLTSPRAGKSANASAGTRD